MFKFLILLRKICFPNGDLDYSNFIFSFTDGGRVTNEPTKRRNKIKCRKSVENSAVQCRTVPYNALQWRRLSNPIINPLIHYG